jgi:hypothetical protein
VGIGSYGSLVLAVAPAESFSARAHDGAGKPCSTARSRGPGRRRRTVGYRRKRRAAPESSEGLCPHARQPILRFSQIGGDTTQAALGAGIVRANRVSRFILLPLTGQGMAAALGLEERPDSNALSCKNARRGSPEEDGQWCARDQKTFAVIDGVG